MDINELKIKFEKEINFKGKNGVKTKNLLGLKSKYLEVIDYRKNKVGITWICKCKCGNIAYVKNELNFNKRIGCSSCTTSIKSSNKNKTIKHYSFYRRKYKEYRDGANKRHFTFNITFDEFYNISLKDCYYCGEPPGIKKYGKNLSDKNYDIKFNGIDRIDSSKGYLIENCVPCCTDCNISKNKNSKEYFLKWVEKVYLFNKSSTTRE